MIELKDIRKSYGDKVAVDGINLKIDKGEICVLIGPSGCGKSTTLKMMNRLIEPTSGSIFIGGKDIRDSKPELLRRGIGYVIQSVGLFPHMTVCENISVVPKLLKWGQSKIDDQVKKLLELVELGAEYGEKYPSQLSGGEAQRVGVARALAAEPDILLMDEPFGALDPVTRESLQSGLLRIQEKVQKTIVFVTHDIDEAVRLASKIALMKDGKIIQYDTPQNILSDPADRFTARFIGKDRALKNLSRMCVKDAMEAAISVCIDADMAEAKRLSGSNVYAWVTDESGKLSGWLSNWEELDFDSDIETNMTFVDPVEYSIPSDSSLKDALAKLVMHGVVVLPVADKGVIKGELSIKRILESGSE